jgi:hypothetical protein
VNDILVPPRPSPAILASAELTSVKDDGSTRDSEPTMGIGTDSVDVTVPPLPSA